MSDVEVVNVQMFSTSALPPQFEQSATLDEFTWVLVAVLLCINVAAVTLQVVSEKKKLGNVILKMQRLSDIR